MNDLCEEKYKESRRLLKNIKKYISSFVVLILIITITMIILTVIKSTKM
jgi:uncharacterized protein YqiB (DUF1249 family)